MHSLIGSDGRLVHIESLFHRAVLIHDYSEFLLHVGEFQPTIRTITLFHDWLNLLDVASLCKGICGTSIALSIRVIKACFHPSYSDI
jgi:hypothetical protein